MVFLVQTVWVHKGLTYMTQYGFKFHSSTCILKSYIAYLGVWVTSVML